MEILRGWGVSKAKILIGKYGALVEIQKTFCGRGMDIFWNNTMLHLT